MAGMFFPQVPQAPNSSSSVGVSNNTRRCSNYALFFLGAFLCVTLFAGSAWAQAPTLSDISPSSLTPGGQVTLTGSGFGETHRSGFVALWNSRSVPVISLSHSQIIVSVTAGTTSGLAFANHNGAWSNGI